MFKAQGIFILLLPVVLLVLAACSGGGGTSGSNTIAIPQAPSGVSQAVSASPVRVVLTWNSTPLADHYRVYRSGYSGFIPSPASFIGVSSQSSYTDENNVLAGNDYYYRITTVSTSGIEGQASAEVMVGLKASGPPETLLAVGGDAQVMVDWSPVNGASSYSVYRSLISGGTATSSARISSSLTGTTGYIDFVSPLVNGQTYFYAVSSTNAFGEGALSPEISAIPLPALAGGSTITIHGKILYADKEYGNMGFTNTASLKPVRFADIEVVDAANASLSALASGATLSDGTYSLSVPSSMLGRSVYVQVISSAMIPSSASGTRTANVMNLDRSLYGAGSSRFLLAGSTAVDLSLPTGNQAAGAFNILDVLTTGFEFVNAMTLHPAGLSLDAFWEQGNARGTWYCIASGQDYCTPSGEGIYILDDPSGSGDTDQFDDDVIWHEFGHFAADKLSLDQSPGGVHYLNSNDLDLRLSWSEGWGDFFPGAVKYWLKEEPLRAQLLSVAAGTPLSLYIDTSMSGAHLTINIASPESSSFCNNNYFGSDSCKYASNEVAVANILWNLMSDPSMGLQPVWDVFTGYIPHIPTSEQVTLESFWDGWLVRRSPGPGELLTLNAIYGNRLITYAPDLFENDDSIASSATYSTGTPQTHTLYSEGNADYVKFTPGTTASYTMSTGELKNGADTFLTLYNSAGTPLATNDNTSGTTYTAGLNYDYYDQYTGMYIYPYNNAANLSSRIDWSLTAGETYYISVASSNDRPKSAGKYGSFTLTITSP